MHFLVGRAKMVEMIAGLQRPHVGVDALPLVAMRITLLVVVNDDGSAPSFMVSS